MSNNDQLLVGYIAPDNNQTGIDGSLTIRAYLDSDLVVISDTYNGEETDSMGTTTEWVNGRDVLTTTEWNSIHESGNELSFKVRIEANEGLWVTVPPFRGTATQLANSASEYELETTPYGKIYTGSNPDNYVWFNEKCKSRNN